MAIKDAIHFGITTDAATFDATESISITHRCDKAEAVGENGNIFSVSYYNSNGEWTCSGYKGSALGLSTGDVISSAATLGADGYGNAAPGFTGADGATGGAATGAVVVITEITTEESAEDWQKYTVKGQFWDNINS